MNDYPRTERSRTAVEERFVVEVQSYLQELMDLRGMNRSQLADAMGVSRARITQIFSDECTNLTVRLLARAAHALGEEPEISSHATQRRRDERRIMRHSAIIGACDNVVQLTRPQWVDFSREPGEDQCGSSDKRLGRMVERAKVVGAI